MVKRFDIYLISLDPTLGSEIQKTRPCVVISPNEMHTLSTVIVAPMTTKFGMVQKGKKMGNKGMLDPTYI